MKIFIARLPFAYEEQDIAALFAPYGDVSTVNLIMDRESGRSKCYAFVEMPNDEEAANAISNLDQKTIDNKQIAVSQAQDRPKTNSGGGFNRGGSNNKPGGYNQRNNNYGSNRNNGSYSKDRGNHSGGFSRGNDKGHSDY